jgi:hypothetical protein
MYPWPVGVLVIASAVSLLFGLGGVWSLWRVRKLLAVVPDVQERLDTLSNSVSLLTDTTEACFKALAMQFQFLQAQTSRPSVPVTRSRPQPATAMENPAETSGRKARQRRVVGAAKRGEAVADIAAREDLSESEVALRLHMNRDSAPAAGTKRYGSLLS